MNSQGPYRDYPGGINPDLDDLVEGVQQGHPLRSVELFLSRKPSLTLKMSAVAAIRSFLPELDLVLCLQRSLVALIEHNLTGIVDDTVLRETMALGRFSPSQRSPVTGADLFSINDDPRSTESKIRASILLRNVKEAKQLFRPAKSNLDPRISEILWARILALDDAYEDAFEAWSAAEQFHPLVLVEIFEKALKGGDWDFAVRHLDELKRLPRASVWRYSLTFRITRRQRRWIPCASAFAATAYHGILVFVPARMLCKGLESDVSHLIADGMIRVHN